MNLLRPIALALLVSVSAATPAAARQDPPPLMTEMIVLGIDPVTFGDIAWGDYDGNGKLDAMVAGNRGTWERPVPITQLYVYRQDTFVERPDPAGGENPIQVPAIEFTPGLNEGLPILTDVWHASIAWADYDADGDLDVAVTGRPRSGGPVVVLYQNTGEATRFEKAFTLEGTWSGDLKWGDLDGDGALDMVLGGLDAAGVPATLAYRSIRSAEGVPGDAFVPMNLGVRGVAHGTLDLGDYDADGDLDLIVAGLAEPQEAVTRIYNNDGFGGFTEAPSFTPGLFFPGAVWGDFDADGDLDVVVAGGKLGPLMLEGTLDVFRNDAGVFTSVRESLFGSFEGDPVRGRYLGDLAVADFHNDGIPGFALFGVRTPTDPDVSRLFRNRGSAGFFKDGRERLTGGYQGGMDVADYDGDGDVDLIVMGEEIGSGPAVQVYRNSAPRPGIGTRNRNRSPEPPSGLQSSVRDGAVQLTWNAGSDDLTPASALTYAVRIASAESVGIVAGHAGPGGRRHVPRGGNAGTRLQKTVRLGSLPPGEYRWSVQSVDSGYVGSAWSDEAVFIVTP